MAKNWWEKDSVVTETEWWEEDQKESPDVSRETKDPTLYEAAYPRLTRVAETGEGSPVVSTGLDILSMLPRGVAAGVGTLAETLGGRKQTVAKLTPEQMEDPEKIQLTPEQFEQATAPPPGESFIKQFARIGGEGKEGVEALAEEIARDPATLPAIALSGGAGAIPKVAASAKLSKLIPLLAETAGSVGVHQAEHVAKGEDISPTEAGIEAGLSLGIPGLGSIATKRLNKILGRSAEELSGVSEAALRAYRGTGKKAIQQAAGTQREVGRKLLTVIDDWESYIPEQATIRAALADMPEIGTENVVKALNRAKVKGPLKNAESVNIQIDDLINDIENVFVS